MSELNKLRWHCRRGTLELDLMLSKYLEACYENADQRRQQAFEQLLALEDTELMIYLMGERVPEDAELADVVTAIRLLPVDRIE